MDNQVDMDSEPAAIFSDQFFAPFFEEEAEARNQIEADSDLDPDWLNALQQFMWVWSFFNFLIVIFFNYVVERIRVNYVSYMTGLWGLLEFR